MSVLCQKDYPNKDRCQHNLTINTCQYQQHCMIFRAIQRITRMRIIKTIIINSRARIKVVVIYNMDRMAIPVIILTTKTATITLSCRITARIKAKAILVDNRYIKVESLDNSKIITSHYLVV